MEDNNSTLYDQYELPVKRKKKILSDLDDIDAQDDVVLVSSVTSAKEQKKKQKEEDDDDAGEWVTTLANLSTSKIRPSKSARNLFGDKKSKKEKKKKRGEPTDYNKEFEPEMALINNLLIEQSRFVDNLQQKYDRMDSLKSSARGTGKFTTDLISGINTARQLSASLIDKKISTKKTIAELEMKERKEMGADINTDDMNNFASEYLKNILTSRGEMSNSYGDYSIDEVDDDGMMNAIDSSIDSSERSADANAYLRYENRGVKIIVEMNEADQDDYDFIAMASDGEVLLDYPLPEHTPLLVNHSTMVATDDFGKKYHVEYRS